MNLSIVRKIIQIARKEYDHTVYHLEYFYFYHPKFDKVKIIKQISSKGEFRVQPYTYNENSDEWNPLLISIEKLPNQKLKVNDQSYNLTDEEYTDLEMIITFSRDILDDNIQIDKKLRMKQEFLDESKELETELK